MHVYAPEQYQKERQKHAMRELEKRERWTTESDSQYFYPGFAPNHLSLREKRDKARERTRRVPEYDPAQYNVGARDVQVVEVESEPAASKAPTPETPVSTGTPRPPPATYADAATYVTSKELARCRKPVTKPVSSHTRLKSFRVLQEGRAMPDSSFDPPFHAYGWKNTNPATESSYMKTHNICPPPKEVHNNVILKRSKSAGCPDYSDHEAALAAHPTPAPAPAPSTQKRKDKAIKSVSPPSPHPVVIQVSESSKFVLLDEGRIKLKVRPDDSQASLEQVVKTALQIPPTQPVVLNDANGRPVTLSYSTVTDGEMLHLAKIGRFSADALRPSVFINTPQKIRDLPTAGIRTQPGDRVADCFEHYY